MKKTLLTLILTGVLLSSCNNNDSSEAQNTSSKDLSSDTQSSSLVKEYQKSDLSIISPTGAPALAFYNYATLSSFETNSDPKNITAMMAAGQKDVIVLPTNAGVQTIINKQAEYKIAATITFGNFYIVSLNNDDNNVMDATDTILLFQEKNVPDKLFHYIYGDELNPAIHYVNAVSDAASAIIGRKFVDAETGNNLVPNYVMIAEPALTTVKTKLATSSQSADQITVYANIQEEYKKKSSNLEIFQASVFIKNNVDKSLGESFLNSLEREIGQAINDSSKLSEGMSKATNPNELFGVAPNVAASVMSNNNGMGLGFKFARDNKDAIANFLSIFSINNIDEKIYF